MGAFVEIRKVFKTKYRVKKIGALYFLQKRLWFVWGFVLREVATAYPERLIHYENEQMSYKSKSNAKAAIKLLEDGKL
jgi:hypothetical protein